MLTFGSLFAGIGGIDLGLERAGIKCLWQVENNEYANKVLEKHWPDVKRYGDIRTVDFTKVEYVDVIAGGFPCQDISNAGKRDGIKGERSGLWKEFARAIREVGPKYVIVENVSALRHRGLDTVIADLASCGYDAEWDCIPAKAVGAPHRRDRLFIIANRNKKWVREYEVLQTCSVANTISDRCEQMPERFFDPGNTTGTSLDIQKKRQDEISNTNKTGLESRFFNAAGKMSLKRYNRKNRKEQWQTEPSVGRVANGVSNRVDRIKCLGNAVVPQVAEVIGELLLNEVKSC